MKKELARRNLIDFSREVFGLEPAKHHLEWLKLLQDKSISRLLIIAPPESAKSTYISVVYPLWYIGKHIPDACALVSCTATQAEEFGGAITRTIENSANYHAVFPDVIPWKESSWSKSHIFIKRPNLSRPDPTFMFTGMMGPIIGRRFNLAIVDDPTDQEIAYSELQRERQKTWFKQTLLSRLTVNGRCIVILTRWHEDDLAAELMKPEMGFKVIHLPAILDNGESYWPEHWPLERLLAKQSEVGHQIFRCMYMGEPFDIEGSIFKREWFTYYTVEPEIFKAKIQLWDTALKATRKSDYNVCVTGAVDIHNRIYILDVFRAQMETPDLEKAIVTQNIKHHPNVIGIEDKVSGATSIQRLKVDHTLPIKPIKVEANKVLRARGITPFFERGEVLFRAGAKWLDELEHELLAFPVGRHDDQVDAIVHLIMELQHMAPRLQMTESHGYGMEGVRTKEF